MDLAAIAAAIATRFAPAAITPPTGYDDIVEATHLLPQALGSTPRVLVFPPEGTFEQYRTGIRTGDLVFPVRCFIAQTSDLATAMTTIYAWYSVLIDQLVGNIQLGQTGSGEVTHAGIAGSRMGRLEYAGTEYVGIEFAVTVHLAASKSFVA